MHDDTAAVASHAILTVIKRVGAFESRAAAPRKVGSDVFKGCRAVEKLQLLLLAGLSRNLYCQVPSDDIFEDRKIKATQIPLKREWCHF